MSTFKGLLWGLFVGILGAYIYDKWLGYRARRVAEGSTGSIVSEVQRFFGTPVQDHGAPPGVASTAAGAAASLDSGGCGCRG